MPQNYYTFPATAYPPLSLAVVDRVKLFVFTELYPSEAVSELDNRIFIADITGDYALRESVKQFNWSAARFPFTVYNIGDFEEFNDYRAHINQAKTRFSSIHNTMLYIRPIVLNIPMITFYHTPNDFDRARTILMEHNATKNILEVPITINSVLTSTPAKVEMEIGKGSYAWEFSQMLTTGRVWDLVHNMKVLYYEVTADDDSVYPVDDIYLSLIALETKEQETKIYFIEDQEVPDTPAISSTDPADEATDVLVDSSIIIDFNTAMVELSVEDALILDPIIDADLIWNSDSTQLLIDPVWGLQSGTTYEITIEDTAESGDEIPIEEDYVFSFTTISS